MERGIRKALPVVRGLAMAKLLSKEQLVRFLYIVRTHYGHGKEKAVSSQLHLDASAFVQKLSYNVGDTVDLDWLTFVIEQERIRRSIEWRATTTQQSSAVVDVPVTHVRVLLGNLVVVTRASLQVVALLQVR